MAVAIEIPLDWNPGTAVWPGTGGRAPVDAAFRALASDLDDLNTRSAGTQASLDATITQETAIRTKLDAVVTAYNLHLGTAGVHVDSDTENTLAAPVATDLTADILLLVNDAYDMLLAHMAQGAAIHPGGADATNVMTATYPATTEAEAVALHNDIHAQYTQHIANNGAAFHTNADVTNTYTEGAASDWDDLITTANGYKNTTGFQAHVVLTAGPTHGATGAVDLITAPDAGTQIAAVYVELIEVKDNYNVHAASEGYHDQAGAAEATADATTEATTVALANALKATLNVHFPDTDVHLGADVATVAAADITEYEDALPLVAALRTQFGAHIPVGSVHTGADAGNTETVIGAGGDVPLLGVGGAVTILLTAA